MTVVSPDYLRKLLPAILLLVLGYTLAKKELGRHHAPRFHGLAGRAAVLRRPLLQRADAPAHRHRAAAARHPAPPA